MVAHGSGVTRAERRVVAEMTRFTSETMDEGQRTAHRAHVDAVREEAREATEGGLANIARHSSTHLASSNSPVGRWLRGTSKALAQGAAKRMQDAARLKALQRTPYPMVLARTKLLLDRLTHFKGPIDVGSGGPRGFGSLANGASGRRSPSRAPSSGPGAARVSAPGDGGRRGADSADGAHVPGESGNGGCDAGLASLDEGGVGRLPLDKIMEELNATFAYVSDFLRHVPEQTRILSVLWSQMCMYKKDQEVYRLGDDPAKFYIILTGTVEVWTHPPGQPREKTVLATLRKGQSFGDKAIRCNEPRDECVTSASNCSFLTIDRHAFLDIFGGYFAEKQAQAEAFFYEHVDVFKKVPLEDGRFVIRHMLQSSFPAGREWDPASDSQVFFVASGLLTLEAHDRKYVVRESELRLASSSAPSMATSGTLANVVLDAGRVVGTLGHEEELRRRRRQLIPKRLMTRLQPGSVFGGGPDVMGDGDLQRSLKVLADTNVVLYHIHIGTLMRQASPTLLKALRDDTSFKLTYYFGRNGTIGGNTVVGHEEALLQAAVRHGSDHPSLRAAMEEDTMAVHIARTSMPQQRASTAGGQARPSKKHAKRMAVHVPGTFNPEVQRALRHIAALGQGLSDDPTYAKHLALMAVGESPTQRFWKTPSISCGPKSAAINPLLGQIFPEGLAPLGAKISRLMERHARCGDKALGTLLTRPATADSAPAAAAAAAADQWDVGGGFDSSSSDCGEVAGPASAGALVGAHHGTRAFRSTGEYGSGGAEARAGGGGVTRSLDVWPAGPAGSCTRPPGSTMALLAAGTMWTRARDTITPAVRQNLTYNEIAMLQQQHAANMRAAAGSGGPPLPPRSVGGGGGGSGGGGGGGAAMVRGMLVGAPSPRWNRAA